MPRIQVIHSLDHMDGNTGDDVLIPTLGANVRVRTRSQLQESRDRVRERYFQRTDGPQVVQKQHFDERTGRVLMEPETVQKNGIDIGELHDVETPRPPSLPDPFNPATPAEKAEKAEVVRRFVNEFKKSG